MRRKTADAARGKWRGILLSLGVGESYLSGKHGPCPKCGGRDRFRFDNREGAGTWICSQCGAGNGFDLLRELKGWDFAEAAKRVDEVVGNVELEPVKQRPDEQSRTDMLNRLWKLSRPLRSDDLAHRYLASRVTLPETMSGDLRFCPDCPAPDSVRWPALLALVRGADGEPVNIHRTFLDPAGRGKAAIGSPRAMMPGEVPAGSAVRLFPLRGTKLGIAEGIETALAAAARFGIPVWAALNTSGMKGWSPPTGVTEVVVFGDHDAKFGGQAAAYALAHRLAARHGLSVEVEIPSSAGRDWADLEAT